MFFRMYAVDVCHQSLPRLIIGAIAERNDNSPAILLFNDPVDVRPSIFALAHMVWGVDGFYEWRFWKPTLPIKAIDFAGGTSCICRRAGPLSFSCLVSSESAGIRPGTDAAASMVLLLVGTRHALGRLVRGLMPAARWPRM